MSIDKEVKHYCINRGCQNEIPEPKYCCNMFDCGCQGMPIEPPFCSSKCYDEYINTPKNEERQNTNDYK